MTAPERTSSVAAAMSGAMSRSSSRCGTLARSNAAHRFQRRRSTCSGAWKSQPWQPPAARCRGSCARFSAIGSSRRAAVGGHGDVVLLVRRGRDRNPRWPGSPAACSRDISAAAVTCGIMKPELRPGSGVRNAGRPRQRRVDQHGDAPLGQRADLGRAPARCMSAANATGSAWKLPPESDCRPRRRSAGCRRRRWPRSASTRAAWRSISSTAPITCGWQRRQ